MFFREERSLMLAKYVLETKSTVRAAAKHFGISKSTVHKDLTSKLLKINRGMYLEVAKILEFNKSERHLRGGEATRQKYLKTKKKT